MAVKQPRCRSQSSHAFLHRLLYSVVLLLHLFRWLWLAAAEANGIGEMQEISMDSTPAPIVENGVPAAEPAPPAAPIGTPLARAHLHKMRLLNQTSALPLSLPPSLPCLPSRLADFLVGCCRGVEDSLFAAPATEPVSEGLASMSLGGDTSGAPLMPEPESSAVYEWRKQREQVCRRPTNIL